MKTTIARAHLSFEAAPAGSAGGDWSGLRRRAACPLCGNRGGRTGAKIIAAWRRNRPTARPDDLRARQCGNKVKSKNPPYRFSIAPMMDWTESSGGSMAWRRACEMCTRPFAFSFAFVPVREPHWHHTKHDQMRRGALIYDQQTPNLGVSGSNPSERATSVTLLSGRAYTRCHEMDWAFRRPTLCG